MNNNKEYGATHVAAASAAGGLFGLSIGLLVGRRKKAALAAEPVAALAAEPVATEPVAEPAPVAPLTIMKGTRELINAKELGRLAAPQPDKEKSVEEILEEGRVLLAKCRAERAAAEEAEETVKVSVVLPWRFNRPLDIPRPDVVDARRLGALPAEDIQFALHRAYMDDLSVAERLHASLRKKAERAVFPLREDAVGALEDIYVLHPDRVMHD